MRTIKMYTPVAIFLIAMAIMTVASNLAAAYASRAAPMPQSTAGEELAELSDLLLDPDEFAAITGANSARQINGPFTEMAKHDVQLDRPSCASPYAPVVASSYAGSGYRDVVQIGLIDSDANYMGQAVVRFPDRGHAAAYAKTLAEQWADCAGHGATHTISDDAEPTRWTFGEPTVTKDKVYVISMEGPSGLTCQRAAKAAGEIFIDVLSCGYGEAIVLAIAGKAASDL